MRKVFTCIVLLLFVSIQGLYANAPATWTSVPISQAPPKYLLRMPPAAYLVYQLDVATLKNQLWSLPSDHAHAQLMQLPMGDGTFREFRVWETSMMPTSLAAQFPNIKTFTAEAADDSRVTAKLDFTEFGFHAAIFEGDKVSFVDPYDNLNDGYYVVHYKNDEDRPFSQRMKCEVHADNEMSPAGAHMETMQSLLPATNLYKIKLIDPSGSTAALMSTGTTGSGDPQALTVNGTTLRTYRLALSANNWYCRAATGLTTPTIGQCFSTMTTSMNRVNGVYNRELSVQLNFATNENLMIWPTATGSANGTDPFDGINTNASACLTQNQTSCDTRIGSANYDVGHVFTTGAGGLASLGVICNNSFKAQGATGSSVPVGDAYDIDYVCHEMGHQFGSSHTFNNNLDGSCGTNASSAHAYEPASGATIMDYAGICSPDNVQSNSDPYFSINSLEQIQAHMAGSGGTCAVTAAAPHAPVTIATFTATYNIPYKTPFELTSPTATGSAGDTAITYGWCQYNLGDFGKRLNQTFIYGPIFRSYQPVYTTTRIFPRLSNVLSGVLSNAGEKAPDTARFMTFKTVIRNVQAGMGCFRIPDDSIHINASSTGAANGYAGFKVTSQNTTGIVYTGGSTQTVTWNVVGSNNPPVSAANVDIFMSVDGGNTWPYTIGTFPNTGTASVSIPNPGATSTTARIKVKGSGNVFFNINSNNFTVNPGATTAPVTGTFTVCTGSTTTLADATPGGTWTSSTPSVATVGSATGIVTGIAAGTATITYNVGSGPATAVVTVTAAPATPSAITGSSVVCAGTPDTLSTISTGGVWSSSTPAVATVGTGTGIVTGLVSGTSTISYTVTNACGSASAIKVVTVSIPAAVAAIGGTLSFCEGASTTLTDATPSGVWSSSNLTVATIGVTGITTGLAGGTSTIRYTVTNALGCVSSSSAIVTVNAIPAAATTPSGTVMICTGGTALLTASPSTAGLTYQWQDGGINIPGATGGTYTAGTVGNFRVLVTSAAGCTGTSAVVAVTTSGSASVTPTILVSATPGTNICATVGTVSFTATTTNGGSTPAYQWYVNGTASGTSAATFAYVPANGDVVKCVLTSSLPCAVPAMVSDSVTMTVAPAVTPSVSIDPAPNDTVCTSQSATYTAIPVGGGTAPTYQWTVNGINVATGPSFSNTPSNGDVVVCRMTSNASCRTTTVVTSAPMTITVQAPLVNTIYISASSSSIVAGENVTFVAVAANAGSSATYQWFIDGIAVPGATNITFTTNTLTNGQMVHCKVTSSLPCVLPHTAMSGSFTMSVTTGIWEVTGSGNSFTLNPNPNKGTFVINGKLTANEHVAITVTNVLGQVVSKHAADMRSGIVNEQVIMPSGLAKGTYFVTVNCGQEHVVFRMTLD